VTKYEEGLDDVESRIFHRLRQLSTLLARDPSLPTGPDQKGYANAVLLLERQIGLAVQERLLFIKKFGEKPFNPPSCNLYIPAMIFCYLVFRATPVRSSIYDLIVVRMQNQLEALSPDQWWRKLPLKFWLWSLVFAGAAAMGRPQQDYLAGVTATLCTFLDLRSWDDAKTILREYAWVDSTCERPCKAFWDVLDLAD
jgi:hypothetical protein